MKKEIIATFAILIVLTSVLAVDQMKFLITPSSGTFRFSKQGGILEFAISNYGDLSGYVEMEVSGEGAEFIEAPPEVFSRPREVNKFDVKITPNTRVQYEKSYYVEITFSPKIEALADEQVSGVAIVPSVSIPLKIIFEKKGNAPTLYQSVSVPSSSTQVIGKDYAFLVLILLALVAIIGGLFVYFKSKKKREEDEDWEEEVVVRRRRRKRKK